jgi:NAD(P)H-flavin reductase
LEKGPIRFFAGQYLEVLINNKAYPYSIASAPEAPEIELHIQFSPEHHGSMIVANAFSEQTQVEINAPIGAAYLREKSFKPILLVAGGTGIAPHKSIIEHLVQQNSKREIYLYWGVRQPEYLYLHEQFLNLSKILKNFHYIPIISGLNDSWHGKKGLVHQAVLDDFKDLSQFEAYICGPFDMCFIAREDFAKQGLLRDNMYSDAFQFG